MRPTRSLEPGSACLESLERTIAETASVVLRQLESRSFDAHRRYLESLVTHLFCHELVSRRPELGSRLWTDYRPWPEESSESIDVWIDGDGSMEAVAVEIDVGDPASDYSAEGSRVVGELVADVLELATATQHRSLGRGYVLHFGPPRYLPVDTPIGRVVHGMERRTWRFDADALHPHRDQMDRADYEELLHPGEATPSRLELTLVDRGEGASSCYWLLAVSLPR